MAIWTTIRNEVFGVFDICILRGGVVCFTDLLLRGSIIFN